jgi:hypothetical protein
VLRHQNCVTANVIGSFPFHCSLSQFWHKFVSNSIHEAPEITHILWNHPTVHPVPTAVSCYYTYWVKLIHFTFYHATSLKSV